MCELLHFRVLAYIATILRMCVPPLFHGLAYITTILCMCELPLFRILANTLAILCMCELPLFRILAYIVHILLTSRLGFLRAYSVARWDQFMLTGPLAASGSLQSLFNTNTIRIWTVWLVLSLVFKLSGKSSRFRTSRFTVNIILPFFQQ